MPDMTAITSANWFPVFTALGGFVTASITDWLRDQRAAVREREARAASRREQLLERRTIFQRQTLLDLQDAVMKLIRTTGQMNLQDKMAFRETGEWQKQLYGADLGDRAHAANVHTLMLGVRVRDEAVRRLLDVVRRESISATLCRSSADAERAMLTMGEASRKLNERIGEILRMLDDDEDAWHG